MELDFPNYVIVEFIDCLIISGEIDSHLHAQWHANHNPLNRELPVDHKKEVNILLGD